MDPGDPSSHGGTQALRFSSGNPRIEETSGLMHLHPNPNPNPNPNNSDVSTTAPDIPAGRKPLVCVLGVPNSMTYADFCNFRGSFIQHIKEMRIKDWIKTWVVFSLPSATILSIALVFRSGLILLARSADIVSNSLKNLHVLFAELLKISVSLNKESHAIGHWKETHHCYSLELETQRVWDYVKDNYVHQRILSKTDGKPVVPIVSMIVSEYNELLASQLESQKIYFESVLQDMNAETDKMVSEMVDKTDCSKLQKLQAKLNKSGRINENLLENKKLWEEKILEMEESNYELAEKKCFTIEGSQNTEVGGTVSKGKGRRWTNSHSHSQLGTVSVQRNDGATSSVPAESSAACSTKKSGKSNNRRKK
ncbi:hypothetical protein Sjap_019355 [Stephania japonica]|uniref:UBP-type domain-containing protein n=1 Tax=Stephania japonica TaxID=461633 RepID=A0AAP0EZX4_9MAGN